MKKLPFLLCLIISNAVFAQGSKVIREYIATFKDVAIAEMHRTGVPAAITLAQGIHETSAGQSDLVKRSNNHFGIKCKSDWKGQSVSHDDDARGECFRKYENPFDSYKDHSDFLKTRSHYGFLFKLDPTDYEAWAYGLKKAGYATNPKYPQVLIRLIRDYDLQDYTLLALESKKEGGDVVLTSNTLKAESASNAKTSTLPVINKSSYPSGIFKINGVKVMVASRGTSYLKIAEENDLSLSRLFEINDMFEADIVDNDQLIYLQRKPKKGATAVHIVAAGETMRSIAQSEGVRLESLMELNYLKDGMQPKPGEKIYMQEHAPAMPALFSDLPKGVETAAAPLPKTAVKEERFVVHTVQAKETLYSISRKYGVSLDDIRNWNELKANSLSIGQQLRIKK